MQLRHPQKMTNFLTPHPHPLKTIELIKTLQIPRPDLCGCH